MKFEIKPVKNGLKLLYKDGSETEEIVYVDPYNDNEVEAFADFLRTINEYYGPTTSRYSKARIYILVEPGDKYQELGTE